MFLNPTRPPLHVKVPVVSWTVMVLGLPGRALLKFISLLSCLSGLGRGSEANATKDLVDALTCVSYLALREWKPSGHVSKVGPPARSLTPPDGARNECNSFMNLRLSKTTR